jgi:hypothetical protein
VVDRLHGACVIEEVRRIGRIEIRRPFQVLDALLVVAAQFRDEREVLIRTRERRADRDRALQVRLGRVPVLPGELRERRAPVSRL